MKRLNLEFVRNFHNQEIQTDFRISPIQRHYYITSSDTYQFFEKSYILFLIAVSLCTSRISKTYPSFLTVKEGSTSHLGLLPLREEEGNRSTRCSKLLRSKVGGPSKVFAIFCGMGPPGERGLCCIYRRYVLVLIF